MLESITMIIKLLGGVALFLFGMNVMGDGLAKVSGGKLESILEKFTSRPLFAVLLGAGREKKTDTIDYGAGIVLYKKTGDKVSVGETIAILYAENEERLKKGECIFNTSYIIGDEKPKMQPLIYKTIR